TTLVPPGGATMVEFKVDYPGRYILVDHALSRAVKGLTGILTVHGEADASIFSSDQPIDAASGHCAARRAARGRPPRGAVPFCQHARHAPVTPRATGTRTMAAMDPMIELHPPADALDGLGLPAIPYPVALPVFQSAVANDGGPLPLADMLRGLQLRATDARVDWHRVEPAMSRLAELLAGDDSRERVALSGDGWRLEVTGDANARHAVVLQRGACRIAALGALRD